MKEFSEIKKGKITLLGVTDTWECYFTYRADEEPTDDIDKAGGLIDHDDRPLGVRFSGRVVSVVHNTEDDLISVQDKLRSMGWTTKT